MMALRLSWLRVLAPLWLLACATPAVSPTPPPMPVHASQPPCSALGECLAACTAGTVRACTVAAERLRYGVGPARDLPRAERLYRQACEARDGLGCTGLGWLSRGPAAEEAFARARPLLEVACTRDDPEACFAAGLLKLEGKGGPVEEPAAEARLRRALELLTASCHAGMGAACVRAASLFEAGPAPLRDDSRALVYLRKGCDGGVAGGCSALALRYLTGRGVPRDNARAQALLSRSGELFRASCEAGEAAACVELGQAFALGQGVPVDRVRALGYHEKACALGEASSCQLAARWLREGAEGVAPDAGRASRLEGRARALREEDR